MKLVRFLAVLVSLFSLASVSCFGAELAASFEVKVDRMVDKAEMGYGFRLREKAPFAEGQLVFEIPGPAVSFGPKNLYVGFDTAFRMGLWHHLAVAYREDTNEAKVWVDGRLMGVGHTFSQEPVGVAAFKKLSSPARDFPGTIRNVKTWDKIPADDELFPPSVLGPILDAVLVKEASLVKGFDGTPPACGLLPIAIDRHSKEKHVPFRTPSDASVLTELRMAAAQGEIEDASFLVLPFRDVKNFHVRITDLKGPSDTVKAEAIDVRIVKNWLQCRWGWTSFYAGGIHFPQLTPELLVHDDRLVTVDETTHKNMLRLSYPEGERYISVSDYANLETYPKFNYNLEPVHDAEKLLPYDLRRGDSSQLWLTLRCPSDAKGGEYRGAVVLSAGGKDVHSFPLVLTVHPFKLPRPGCHHDPDRTFLATWMGHYSLKEKLIGAERYTDGGYSLSNAIRRQVSEFRNLAEHNCGYPWTTAFGDDAEFADWQLDIQKATGCEMKPILGDIGVSWNFALWATYPPEGKKDLSVEANREVWEKEMREYSNKVAKASALVEKKLGHRDIVYYAYDEAYPTVVRREFPFFATLNHFGGTSFTTGGVDSEAAFMTDWDDASGGFNAEKSRRWHEAGARIFSYASPHGGPECPDIWRREKGLGSYFADLDGVNEYIWYEGAHIWNEFLDGPGREYKNFNMVYPTADGVLDTVQWEAVREGLDDIRYFTLLYRIARAAMKAKDAALVTGGRRAVQWMETADWRKGDLDALRLEAAKRIVALRDALKPTGFDLASVTDLPASPSDLKLVQPKPDSADTPEALEKKAASYADRCMGDVACAFYRAAAAKATGEKKAMLLIAAAEEAARYRDVKTALACLDEGVALGKDAGESFRRMRVRRAMLPFACLGNVTPDKKAVADAEAVVEKFGTFQDRFEVLKLVLASGEAARAAAGFVTVFENTKTLKFDAAKAAGEAYRAAGDMKKASAWFKRASDLTGMQRYEMLNAAAETALAAGDQVAALDLYMAVLKCINKTEQEGKYNAAQARVAMLSRRSCARSRAARPSNPTPAKANPFPLMRICNMRNQSRRSVSRFLPLLFVGTALALSAGPMTRYDVAVPFRILERAPAEALRWTPQAFVGDVAKVSAVVGPLADVSRAEVERWHRIGVKVYAELPAEGARTNAANAYLRGFDGLVAAPSPALAEGVKDVAAYARMNELARKVAQLKTPDKVGLEGRMGLFQLDRIDVAKDDPDVRRLEAYARIRRLAAFAKEPDGIDFDLKLVERPPLKRQVLKTKRHGQPTKSEIAAALKDLRYWQCWNDTFWKYEIPLSRADGEKHIGYPDPGIETFCWREYASEKLFMERRFELLKRKYAKTAALLAYNKDDKDAKPKILDKEESEIRAAYDLLPDFLNVAEEAARLRIAYYLDRFAGRPFEPLPAVVEKKKVVLEIKDDDDLSLD